MPYVNGKRWGAHEFPDSTGTSTVPVAAAQSGTCTDRRCRRPLRHHPVVRIERLHSLPHRTTRLRQRPAIKHRIRRGRFPNHPRTPRTYNYLRLPNGSRGFMPGNMWTTAQAVPLIGFYDFTNRDALRQHLLWFMDSGNRCRTVRLVESHLGLQALGTNAAMASMRSSTIRRSHSKSWPKCCDEGAARSSGDHHARIEQRPLPARWRR